MAPANREIIRSTDGIEVNVVNYERSDGAGTDKVVQIKDDGEEVAHITIHPDGEVHHK